MRLICKLYQSQLIKTPSLAHASLTKLRFFYSPLFPHTSPALVLTASRISSVSSYLTARFPPSSSCKSTCYKHKIPSSQHYNRLNQHLIDIFNALPITLCSFTHSTFKTNLKSSLFTHIAYAHNLNHISHTRFTYIFIIHNFNIVIFYSLVSVNI